MKNLNLSTHNLLISGKKTVAVAESCTGGLLSEILTRISGSSRYFILGIVAYSNTSKQSILKIAPPLIAKKGAVSKEVAEKMAESIRRLSGADFGIGITGITGPGGKKPGKPVGTVFISLEEKKRKLCKKFHFTGNRACIRKKTAQKALEILAGML